MKRGTLILLMALAGCATAPSGVTFADGEREACAQSQDCTVWSASQLQGLVNFVWRKATEAAMKGGT